MSRINLNGKVPEQCTQLDTLFAMGYQTDSGILHEQPDGDNNSDERRGEFLSVATSGRAFFSYGTPECDICSGIEEEDFIGFGLKQIPVAPFTCIPHNIFFYVSSFSGGVTSYPPTVESRCFNINLQPVGLPTRWCRLYYGYAKDWRLYQGTNAGSGPTSWSLIATGIINQITKRFEGLPDTMNLSAVTEGGYIEPPAFYPGIGFFYVLQVGCNDTNEWPTFDDPTAQPDQVARCDSQSGSDGTPCGG